MNVGLGLENVTNLDKEKPGMVYQREAFTVVFDKSSLCIDIDHCAHLKVEGFTFYRLGKWRYGFIKWLVIHLKCDRIGISRL